MKKIFTLAAAAAMVFSVSAETVFLANPGKLKQNVLSGTELGADVPEGFSMQCMNTEKKLESGNEFTIDDTKYRAIKFSNGAENTVTLPEGYVATKVTFYTTINKDAATDRPCYWAEVAGTTYTLEDNNGIIESFKNYENPNIQSFDIPNLNVFTFKNTGEQPLAVLEVTYKEAGSEVDPTPDALMSWDFTKWSDATVANLKAGANWSDIEKADATEPTAKSKDNCFWQVNYSEGLSPEKYVMANDVVIEELKGLVYTNQKTQRSLAIAVNYPDPDPSKDFGPYHGPAYLWLGSKEVNYFIIPGVPAGAIIKMGVESHKITDARGVVLSIGEKTLTAPNGDAVAVPKTYEEQEWLVPADAAESNDVQIYNTNGCHIYFITVTADSGTSAVENVAIDENAPVEYYNLQGVRVANPENGLYIKRQGNKTVKVLVK
ncbi:MAG: hypothetical protein K2H38_06330 [Muribaculaceae bacterium]|nr:hypothetical protein [Muribaculaceae bacterium]MDE6552535.1 hypothetical protein [Muribaculaceae bacterium]